MKLYFGKKIDFGHNNQSIVWGTVNGAIYGWVHIICQRKTLPIVIIGSFRLMEKYLQKGSAQPNEVF